MCTICKSCMKLFHYKLANHQNFIDKISLIEKSVEKMKNTHLNNHMGIPSIIFISEKYSFYNKKKKYIFHWQPSFFHFGKNVSVRFSSSKLTFSINVDNDLRKIFLTLYCMLNLLCIMAIICILMIVYPMIVYNPFLMV
jgi:hypothetical protein